MPATRGIEDGVLKVLERGTEDEDYGLHLGLMKVKLPGWAYKSRHWLCFVACLLVNRTWQHFVLFRSPCRH